MTKNYNPISRYCTILLSLLALLIVGCGGGGSGSGGSGTLSVRLADAPDPTITEVNITIDRVEAHVDGAWTPITVTPQTYNLLELAQTDIGLGSATLPAGSYNQIRVFISAAEIVDADGTHDATVPSGAQTGLKLNVNYDINADQITTILLDFNVCKSVVKEGTGDYKLKPVIPVVVKNLSGTIIGVATDGTNNLEGAEVTATYTAGDQYPLNTEVNSSMSIADGSFKIWALLPGTYTVDLSYLPEGEVTPITATVTDVVVEAGVDTDIGSVVLAP